MIVPQQHFYTTVTHTTYHYNNHTPTNINNKPTLIQDGSFTYTFKIPSSQQNPYKTKVEILQTLPKTKVGQNESQDLNTAPQNKRWGINEI